MANLIELINVIGVSCLNQIHVAINGHLTSHKGANIRWNSAKHGKHDGYWIPCIAGCETS